MGHLFWPLYKTYACRTCNCVLRILHETMSLKLVNAFQSLIFKLLQT